MSDAPVITPLIQRLAIQRLARPGVLDRGKLQRVHERFAPPAPTPLMLRLFRCARPMSQGAHALPVVRVERSVDAGAPATVESVATPVQVMGASETTTIASASSPVVGNLLSRQSPGLMRSGDSAVKQTNALAPGVMRAGATPVRQLARSASASQSVMTGVIQRVADNISSVAPTAQSKVFRKASPVVVSEIRLAALPQATAAVTTAPLTVFRQVGENISRAAEGIAFHATSMSSPVPLRSAAVKAAPASASFAPLLLRKLDTAVAKSATESATESATVVSHRMPSGLISRAAATTPAQTYELEAQSETAPEIPMDIDWIAQQVASRLERRLEIERERLGVRPWRQSSY